MCLDSDSSGSDDGDATTALPGASIHQDADHEGSTEDMPMAPCGTPPVISKQPNNIKTRRNGCEAKC